MEESSRTKSRTLIHLFQLVIVALVAWGIYNSLARARVDLQSQKFNWRELRWGWLAMSGACYAVGSMAMGVFWFVLLRRLGQHPHWYETMRAFFIGHLGKYVPGKLMVVVIRTALLRSQRVDTTVAAASVFVSTLTMMAAGAFLAGVILLIWFRNYLLLQLLAFGLMVLTAAVTLPPVLKPILRRLKSRETAERTATVLAQMNWTTIAIGWLCSIVCWMFYTLSLWAVIRAIPLGDALQLNVDSFAQLMASVSLAMVTGFVSLVPGGIGVREWVLDQLLVPLVGPAVSIIAAVVLRLTWLLTELVLSTILYTWTPGSRES